VGTPSYMAPELCREPPLVTAKADTYAFGVMLWEMISNHLPFTKHAPGLSFAGIQVDDTRQVEPVPRSSFLAVAYLERSESDWDKREEKKDGCTKETEIPVSEALEAMEVSEIPTAKDWARLVEDCCQVHPESRPNFDQIRSFLERAARRPYPPNFFSDMRTAFLEAQIMAQIQSMGKEAALQSLQDDERKQKLAGRPSPRRPWKLNSNNQIARGFTPPSTSIVSRTISAITPRSTSVNTSPPPRRPESKSSRTLLPLASTQLDSLARDPSFPSTHSCPTVASSYMSDTEFDRVRSSSLV